MGKGARVREDHKKELKEELKEELEKGLRAKVEIIMQEDGKVRVSGPIDDQPLVIGMFASGLNSLAMHWAKKKAEESKIITPGKGLILPGRN